MSEHAAHQQPEDQNRKKDHDILPDQDQLFHDFAEFCIRHGRQVEQAPLDNHEQFRLEDIPPLTEAGIESITYVPPHLEGEDNEEVDGAMFVIFEDPDIIKTLQMYTDKDGNVSDTAVDIDTRIQPERDEVSSEEAQHGEDDETMMRIMDSLQTGIPDPDPEIRRKTDRLQSRFMAFDIIPTEEIHALQDALRRYKDWIEPRTSS